MNRLEMTDIDQRIAKVCDPATANRYEVVFHTQSEKWLVARVLPGEVVRFKEALIGQGGKVVAQQQQRSEWTLRRWLPRYMPEAPIADILNRLSAL